MSNINYFYGSDDEALTGGYPKYFYGLRRTADGEVYLIRANQLSNEDQVEINTPGDPEESYPDFEYGVDYIEGRNANHDLVYNNLKYEQYRWDNRSLYYYIDAQGQLIVRIGQKYTYPTGI